jgi:hypothetical protein
VRGWDKIAAEMAEFELADASFRRLNAAVTVVLFATVAGIAYWYERAYRRWSEQNHPFAAPRARIERTRANYQERRAFVTELAQVIRLSGSPAAKITPSD